MKLTIPVPASLSCSPPQQTLSCLASALPECLMLLLGSRSRHMYVPPLPPCLVHSYSGSELSSSTASDTISHTPWGHDRLLNPSFQCVFFTAFHPHVTSKCGSVISGAGLCLFCSLQQPNAQADSSRCSGNTICMLQTPEVPRWSCVCHCRAEWDPCGSHFKCTMSLATWCCSPEDVE